MSGAFVVLVGLVVVVVVPLIMFLETSLVLISENLQCKFWLERLMDQPFGLMQTWFWECLSQSLWWLCKVEHGSGTCHACSSSHLRLLSHPQKTGDYLVSKKFQGRSMLKQYYCILLEACVPPHVPIVKLLHLQDLETFSIELDNWLCSLDEGKDVDGKDSIATQLAEHTHWDDLMIIIAVVRSSSWMPSWSVSLS